MTLFKLVKVALDELYEEAKGHHGHEVDVQIAAKMKYLSTSYSDLGNSQRKPIDYGDPATRFAYVYKYVATHGDYIVQLLLIAREVTQIFPKGTARLSCVGGGPGSDIIAVVKYLADDGNNEGVDKLVCYLLDKEQAWADTWTEIDDKLTATVKINANFQPLDVTSPDSWRAQRKFLDADVFTLSYFLSEVHALNNDGVVSNFFSTLFNSSKSGALFLYIDNGHAMFNDFIDTHAKAATLDLLAGESNTRWTPRHSEQSSDLGEYLKKFGAFPKIQGYVSYRIYRK